MTAGAKGETTLCINHSDLEDWRKCKKRKKPVETQLAAESEDVMGGSACSGAGTMVWLLT